MAHFENLSFFSGGNLYLFWLSIGVMETAIILKITFIFKSIDKSVLRVWRSIQSKILFILPYTFFDRSTFLNLSAKAPAHFVRSSWVPELIMAVVKSLNWFNPLLFIIRLTEIRLILVFFQPLLAKCGYQDYFIVNR